MQILKREEVSSLAIKHAKENDFHRELRSNLLTLEIGEGVLTNKKDWRSKGAMSNWLGNKKNRAIFANESVKFGYKTTENNEYVIIRKA